MFGLTRDNYYSREADMEYMSCSQYQGWRECEAKQLAKLQGRWEDEPSEAFLVGNYFHTYFEGPEAHAQFIEENENSIFLNQTEAEAAAGIRRLRAPYAQADKMITVAEADPLIHSLIVLPGENELIMSGELFGVPWRVRDDKYVREGRMIIDWKTCANITELKWSDELHEKVTFIDAYGYMMRAAVYSEIEKQFAHEKTDPNFIIVAISKQDYPDKGVFLLNHRVRYDYELGEIKKRLPYIMAVKNGSMKPKRCGVCDYCRATKKLYEIRPYYTLMPEFREAREDDYDAGSVLDNAQEASDLECVPAMRQAVDLGADD